MKTHNQTRFKETEIESIPKGWDVLKFEKIAELSKEGCLPGKGVELCYIGLEHIDQQTLSLNSIGKSSAVTSIKSKFDKGDILFGKLRPYFRKVYRPKFSGICSTDIWVIRAKPGIDQGFLFYLVASEEFIKRASGGSGGTRMPRADWDHLKSELWPVPNDTNEQKRIAEILGALDEMIELNRRMNESLEKIASAIFKHWFVDFNFPNEQGKPYKSTGGKMIESELGMIPKEWKTVNLSNFGNIICGKTPPKAIGEYFGGNVPFIKIPDMHGNSFIVKTEDSLTKEGASFQKNKTIPRGAICVSCIATVGLVSMASSDSQTNQQINSIIPNDNIYQYYLFHTLQNLKDYLLAMGSSGSATLNINTNSFSMIKIVKPANDIMQVFNNIVRPLFCRMESNMQEILTLSQMRDSLLPRLMSGKIRA